ncbi:glycerophosphodiester phosphodiesterase [Ligilactobacillus faecis]|uniref:glycerophosphodiester phosphodiesterase n=1 Tax=Ligilactobacillus faecis TaxID=762833 RepID=UPI0024697232|nr:glycerophosphodiester phosphodiesterase [Ligilactobacillus faecis]WGN89066.1 glycerophosphodiester phosphodiesterase [Ligilactobacillus faecis]
MHSIRDFRLHWKQYLVLFLSVDLFLELLVVPLFNSLTSLLLHLGKIPYLSYTNAFQVITAHPFVTLSLFLELLCLIACVFIQFAFILNGVARIEKKQFSFTALFYDTFSQFKHLDPLGMIFFTFYFLLIVPFSGIFLKSPLLSKVVVPEFILEFLFKKPLYASLITLFYLIVFIISIRLLYVLPVLLLKKQSLKKAVATSFQLTKGRFVFFSLKLLKLSLLAFSGNFLLLGGLYLLQTWFDQRSAWLALSAGSLNVTLLQLGSFLITIWVSVTLFRLLLPHEFELSAYKSTKRSRLERSARLLVFLFSGLTLLSNGFYLVNIGNMPLIISHRGVDNENGVQNTLPALRKTAKSKPDYVEIDVQETKDQRFVVMHDENLKELTGRDVSPQELTLAQLTALTVQENGYTAKIPSLDEYLKAAARYHQKLLVEIKTTARDSKQMLPNFFKEYGPKLLQQNAQLQSLDYAVITAAKKYTPKLATYYILPYNFIFPQTPANGYTMEKTTLNSTFVTQAKLSLKKVYSWTVNDEESFKEAAFLDVDGVITDNVTEAKQVYQELKTNKSYASRLLDYLIFFPN